MKLSFYKTVILLETLYNKKGVHKGIHWNKPSKN